MDDTLPERVRSVIGQIADSHAAFGARIGMSKDKLSKSLSGTRRFTSLELALIAQECGVTVDWLLTGNAPVSLAIAARSEGDRASIGLDVANLTRRFADAYDVLDLIGGAMAMPHLAVPPDTLPAREQGEALAEAASAIVAEKAGRSVQDLATVDLMPLLEEVFGIDLAVQELAPDLDGLAWQGNQRRLILLPPTKNWTRQRFTLAHEVAHILFGDAEAPVVDREIAPGRTYDRMEVRANWFAAAFLMSAGAISHHAQPYMPLDGDHFAGLVVRFRVSPSAMAVRLRSLGLIDNDEFERFSRMTARQCHKAAGTFQEYMTQVNASASVRAPIHIVRALFDAYERGETTLRPVANLLAVDVNELFDVLERPAPEADDAVDPEAGPVFDL